MRYLTGRKLTDETMHHFGLGYAGKNGEQVVQYLRKKGFTDEEIKAYYNAHLKDFLSPEHIKAQYVVFSPDAFSNQKASLDDLKTFTNKISSAGPFLKSAAQVIF